MVNHGLVTAPLFFIVAALAARAGGSEDMRDMGGIAFRAPVLASLFLIVALATLAMPGSSNFAGEFLILLGVFKAKLAIAVIAFVGVVGAAVYALRVFIGAMHNRVGPRVASREIGVARGGGDRPGRGRDPGARVLSAVRAAALRADSEGTIAAGRCPTHSWWLRRPMTLARTAATRQGPPHRLGALSPMVALSIGALLVLLVGLLRGAVARAAGGAGADAGHARRSRSGSRSRASTTTASIVSGALAIDDLALVLDLVFARRRRSPRCCCPGAPTRRASAGHGEYHALLLFSVLGMAVLVSAQNLITLFIGIELLSIPLYVLCAAEFRREGSLESGLKYLVIGSVGSATLVYGLALVYGATGSTDFSRDRRGDSQGKLAAGCSAIRCCWRASGWSSSGSRSRPRWRRFTSGRPTSTRARRRRSRRSWRPRPRPPRSACSCASSTSP